VEDDLLRRQKILRCQPGRQTRAAGEIKRLRGGLAAGVSVLAVHGTIAHNSRSVSSAAMNRKQKVLTIIALIAFVMIGACHYLAWIPHQDYSAGKYREETTWRMVTYQEGQSGNAPPEATVHDGYLQVPTTRRINIPDYYSTLGFVDSKKSMLPQVATLWFMLGVIYAGLFFLLADRKEKR
jgi:hypothetical protein